MQHIQSVQAKTSEQLADVHASLAFLQQELQEVESCSGQNITLHLHCLAMKQFDSLIPVTIFSIRKDEFL